MNYTRTAFGIIMVALLLLAGSACAAQTTDTIGYNVTVTSGQNTVIQSSSSFFGLISRGGTGDITPSVVLSNTGDASAKVEARFADSLGTTFGLIADFGLPSATVLPASNFQLGTPGALVSLNDDGSDVQVATAPVGITNLDARLSVPTMQPTGAYVGFVILTFSNA
jgi:hypothetical protein